ncbi:MAG: OmpA family protein [Alphaproteobacteria bacterium]
MKSRPIRRGSQLAIVGGLIAIVLSAPIEIGGAGLPWLGVGSGSVSAQEEQTQPARVDYLTFAEGAIPLVIGGDGAVMGPDAEHQIRIIDGDPSPFGFISTEDMDVVTEFTYELPALTSFDRFAVPSIREVPGPSQTFTRYVEVLGSAIGPEEGFEILASATLETHATRGEVTELEIYSSSPVRWIKLRLQGGIAILSERMGFDFSEIIGNGTQESRPLADHFSGAWDSRLVKMELVQEGPLVSGCYDRQGLLEGTVEGNILKARGVDQGGSQTVSLFILSVLSDGTLTGVRSSNGGPFRLYTGGSVDDVEGLDCLQPPAPPACGSVIHGIQFDYDSAVIRRESDSVLVALYNGLSADDAASIIVRGHTSSEGSEQYNLSLSTLRAQAVVDDLIRRGLNATRVQAAGAGEAEPIASNNDEAGRALNRRVEIECE